MLSLELFVVCSFVFVFEIMRDQIVLVYSKMDLVIVLYVMLSVSLEFPRCVV